MTVIPLLLSQNEDTRIFFRSVREAMVRGITAQDLFEIIAVVGVSLGFSFSIIWILRHRRMLRREITFWFKLLAGKAEWSDRRWEASYPVSIVIPMSPKPLERHTTVNVSKGGMFLKTMQPYDLNTSFEFILYLSDQEKISGTALVRWVQSQQTLNTPRGMGVEFIGLSENDLNKIRLFLRSRDTREYKR